MNALAFLMAALLLFDDHSQQHTHAEKAKLGVRPPEYPAIYSSSKGM